jgi:hypothetical protein
MKKLSWRAVWLLAAVLTVAPAHAQTGRNRNRIEREEIDAAHAATVYDLVHSRRPAWLNRQHPTGLSNANPELRVFVDGARLEGVDELRQVAAANAERVEYLTSGQTEFRFGEFAPNGSIVVTSRGSQQNHAGEAPSQGS